MKGKITGTIKKITIDGKELELDQKLELSRFDGVKFRGKFYWFFYKIFKRIFK